MSALKHLLRRVLPNIWFADRRTSLPDDVDAILLAFVQEYLANDHALLALLEQDSRDTDEIPSFEPLADRQAGLVKKIVATPARSSAGLIAKARCARIHAPERGFDAALELSLSVADDLLRSAGPAFLPSPLCRFYSSPDARSPQLKEQIMNNLSDVDRFVILRRNGLWRHVSSICTTIGAFAVVALIALPANGIALTWLAVAALLATGAVGLGVPFLLLRLIDHRA